jgi:hypothetical protein
MSDPSDPSRPRSPGRRAADRSAAEKRLPVASGPAREAKPADKPGSPDAGVAAQMLGEGPRRGLKGGEDTLKRARSTYLGAEYSGGADRRPKKGRITKTEI